MKNFKKKIAALGLAVATVASSVMSVSASAWERVDWPGFYTPQSGKFFASGSVVQVTNMRWSANQISEFSDNILKHGIEFEFRPSLNPHNVWSGVVSSSSNLPEAYFEFQPDDDDDIAVCCGQVKGIQNGAVYYGVMSLTKQPGFTTTNLPYTFESEYGKWVPVASNIKDDYWPLYGATYNDGGNNVLFGQSYSWGYIPPVES